MRQDLDELLCLKYPLIFKHRHADPRKTAMCWGFDCGDGWFDLIDMTCALVLQEHRQATRHYQLCRDQEGVARPAGLPVVDAITVERARLALARAAELVPVAIQVKEKFGTLRFYLDGGNEATRHYVTFAESMSSRVCEVCGAPGRLRHGGWLRTLCDTHHEKAQAVHA